jgi:tRNA(Ile)-lysidine synthase
MIEKKFLETIKEYQLLEPGDLVLVGVSGGADSTALLHLLHAHQKTLGISLQVAHLNHMLRKGVAELDANFVRSLAQKLGLPFTVEAINVEEIAKQKKLGVEEAARMARYQFFEKVAEQIGAQKIAVGHTADDNVETFLMRLLRGSGLRGLCGIPPRRGKIIRPLIKIWRQEIEEYVGKLKLVPRRNHTNYESKYLRNSIRLKLLPQLKIYNLNIKEILLQTILLLTGDYFYLEDEAQKALEQVIASENDQQIVLDLKAFKALPQVLQKYCLRLAVEKIKGDLKQLGFSHFQDILRQLDSTEKWELHFPEEILIIGKEGKLIIGREKAPILAVKSFRYSLPIPGEIEIPEVGKKVRSSFVEKMEKGTNPNVAFVDYQALGKEVIVRNKVAGDRFCPLGMMGTKKLQDFFIDEKIPLEEREKIPLLESGGRIIWVAGWRLDEHAKVTEKTQKIVRFELA